MVLIGSGRRDHPASPARRNEPPRRLCSRSVRYNHESARAAILEKSKNNQPPRRSGMADVVDLREVAHTVVRARHDPDKALNPSAKGWRHRSRPLHVNPPSAPNGGIRALKSPDAGSLAAALNPANKQ